VPAPRVAVGTTRVKTTVLLASHTSKTDRQLAGRETAWVDPWRLADGGGTIPTAARVRANRPFVADRAEIAVLGHAQGLQQLQWFPMFVRQPCHQICNRALGQSCFAIATRQGAKRCARLLDLDSQMALPALPPNRESIVTIPARDQWGAIFVATEAAHVPF
jgi:hypothetical protein